MSVRRCSIGGPIGLVAGVLVIAVVVLSACTTSATRPSPVAGSHTSRSSASSSARVVPAPGGGSINESVAQRSQATAAPVPLDHAATYGDGIRAQLTMIQKFYYQAKLPGEISGPALRVIARVTNHSHKTISLAAAVLEGQDARKTPLVAGASPPFAPMRGSLAPGRSADGTYVLELPSGYDLPLSITFYLSAAHPVALFVGTPR